MFLAIFHTNGTIISKGIYSTESSIPIIEGQERIVVENPDESLLTNEIELTQDPDGNYVPQPKQDTRPYCQLILKKDDGTGNFVSAYDPNYDAYLFQAGETIKIEGKLCLDQQLTTPIPGTISFRTPVLRNNIQDRVYALEFIDGISEKTVTIQESGIYKITEKEAYKVRLVGENGEVITQIKIIVAE